MNEYVGARASRPHRGWHERFYLPHFDGGAIVQAITFRLADSLPRAVYEKAATASANPQDGYLRLEKLIDQGRGSCLLGDPRNAATTAMFPFGVIMQNVCWGTLLVSPYSPQRLLVVDAPLDTVALSDILT